jgi:hypothetical protein
MFVGGMAGEGEIDSNNLQNVKDNTASVPPFPSALGPLIITTIYFRSH